jgi:Lipid A core - O-antigen ligase and related enzymes
MIAAAVLGVMVVAIGLSSPQVTERFNTLFDMNYANNAQRVILWKYGWGLFLDHPVMGTGLATLPTPPFFISPEEAASGKPIYGHVHNNFLQMLAENGIIGFGGFVFLFGTIIYTGWTRRGGAGRAWGLTAAVCTSEFLIHGLFDYTLNIPTVVYSYWFIMGFVYVKYRQGDTWRKGDQ